MKLILLPGLDGTGMLFQPAVNLSPAQIDPVVRSYPSDASLSFQELEELIEQSLPDDSPFVLLGESFSGPLALKVAVRQPHGLRGLVLVASFLKYPGPRWSHWFPWNLLFRFGVPSVVLRHYLVGWGASDKLVKLLRRALSQVRPEVMAARVRSLMQVDASDAVACCRVPILCLHGRRDRLVDSRAFSSLAAAKSGVRFEVVDAPHLVLQTEPEACWKHIVEFVEGLEATTLTAC